MRIRILLGVAALPAMLFAQTSSQQGQVWSFDANGNRVEGPRYTAVESPSGSQRVETLRSINGRMVPVQATEDKVLSQDSQKKVVERVIQKYGGDGRPGPPIKVRIEETKGPNGSTTIQSTAYEADINGNMQLFERSTTQVRKGTTIETSTTVERANLNGSLAPVERSQSVERPMGAGSQVESTTYRRDLNGNFTPSAQEVKKISKTGNEETTDAAHYALGPDGKLVLTGRAIDRVKTNADGSQVAETEVYSKFSAGHTSDPNTNQPRLQEQIRREKIPGPGGAVVETTSVRARLPNDPSRFGAYEKVSQTTYTSKDAVGREVKSSTSTVGRRGINGEVVTEQGQSQQSVSTGAKK